MDTEKNNWSGPLGAVATAVLIAAGGWAWQLQNRVTAAEQRLSAIETETASLRSERQPLLFRVNDQLATLGERLARLEGGRPDRDHANQP